MTSLPELADKLAGEGRYAGHSPRLPLAVAAFADLLLGTGREPLEMFLRFTADTDHPAAAIRAVFDTVPHTYPYLVGRLEPLESALVGDVDHVVSRMLRRLYREDLIGMAEAAGGDLLGPVYSAVMAPGDRKARGAHYTPPSVAALMASLCCPGEFEAFYEPCVGPGGMVLAAVRAMRAQDLRPETVSWVCQDIDATALAVCGVQLAAHGIPDVRLVLGSSLQLAPGVPA